MLPAVVQWASYPLCPFRAQADALTAGLSGLQTSVGAAVSAPSAASLDAVGTSVRALADTTAGLASDVSSSC